jgi:hypothetical protein
MIHRQHMVKKHGKTSTMMVKHGKTSTIWYSDVFNFVVKSNQESPKSQWYSQIGINYPVSSCIWQFQFQVLFYSIYLYHETPWGSIAIVCLSVPWPPVPRVPPPGAAAEVVARRPAAAAAGRRRARRTRWSHRNRRGPPAWRRAQEPREPQESQESWGSLGSWPRLNLDPDRTQKSGHGCDSKLW